jgi:pyridoxine kinase
MNVQLALTIAGSDSSGGAGMQADLKTFQEFGVYGLVALTSIVTMDPDNAWAHGVIPIETKDVKKQLKTILAGPPIAAMKTGMLPNTGIIALVSQTITDYNLKNAVIDPVMVCKGDDTVLNPECADSMRDLLIPKATVATPNMFEAGVLSGMGTLNNTDDMKKSAKKRYDMGAANVVTKGGKFTEGEQAADIFYDGTDFEIFIAPKVLHSNNHGAGCTFAAACAAGLALGQSARDAVKRAKAFVTAAITYGFEFNKYIGSVYHGALRLCGEAEENT